MRVAVTGGNGKLGRAVVDRLVDQGHDVVVIDQSPAVRDDVPSTRADLSDYGQALGALTGVEDRWERLDAVVHLAAVPAPGLRPDAAIFANNITSTYNVFKAARVAGITKIVWASSETVLGLPFAPETPPASLPVDEETGPRPASSYSLSKTLEEEMARQFARWTPELSIIGMRFSNVMDVSDYAAFPSFDADPSLRQWNLWGYIDARDGARAVERALLHDGRGADVFVIANADSVMMRSTAELAAEVFPDVPVTRELGQHETLLSIEKARRVLGFEPQHSWRHHAGEHGA